MEQPCPQSPPNRPSPRMNPTDPYLVPFIPSYLTPSFGLSLQAHARKRVELSVVKHPIAAPGVTPGPAVDIVQLVHTIPLLPVHHTPPLGLTTRTAATGTGREVMTIGEDHHHHHPQFTPVEIFPTYRFGATFRITRVSARTFVDSITASSTASSVIGWSGNILP